MARVTNIQKENRHRFVYVSMPDGFPLSEMGGGSRN